MESQRRRIIVLLSPADARKSIAVQTEMCVDTAETDSQALQVCTVYLSKIWDGQGEQGAVVPRVKT